jgi:hypothetical protein
VIQQAVILALLSDYALRGCALQCGLDRHTIRRWWNELNEHHHAFTLSLRMRFPELGRSVDFTAFWQNCLQMMPLSEAMAWLDREGVIVP